MVVILCSSLVWEHGQDRHWARGPVWFPPVLLSEVLIHLADHSPAASNWIFLQLFALLSNQVQIPQSSLGGSQLFHCNAMSILLGLCFIPPRLLCSPLCDKHISQNTTPQVTTSNEVCEEHQFSIGHPSSHLWQLVHQKLHITQQIHGEGARQDFCPGFTNVFASAGIPTILQHFMVLF